MTNQGHNADFDGLKILVVEDDALLAMELEDFLHDLGVDVVGPYGRLDQALDAADEDGLSGALLDLNLRGEVSFPVVEKLVGHDVPVIICSGYVDLPGMQQQLKNLPRISKPYMPSNLTELMRVNFLDQKPRSGDSGANVNSHTKPGSG